MRRIILALALALASPAAAKTTLGDAALITANPVVIDAPGRVRPLQVRVTAPIRGDHLPVVVFSHGDRLSKDDYLTLTEYWAAHGFVVIQPTHLDSRAEGLAADDPARAINWRVRAEDVSHVINALPQIEQLVPTLRGRIDRRRIIAAGHSFGGYTAGMTIGVRPTDPATGAPTDLADSRVLGAVLMAAPGGGGKDGEDLSPAWRTRGAYLNVDWSRMTRPALVIAGREDQSAITSRDWSWQTDAYRKSPGGKCLIVISGVKHYLGGILGQNRTEAGDPAPAAVALVQEASLAFMRSLAGDGAWPAERAKLQAKPAPVDTFECD